MLKGHGPWTCSPACRLCRFYATRGGRSIKRKFMTYATGKRGIVNTGSGIDGGWRPDSNPCLVAVAFSPRFPIAYATDCREESEVTQTRSQTFLQNR